MRREIVAAVRRAVDAPLQRSDVCDCPDIIPSCDACCARIASAALRAALTGEPEGEYRAVRSGDDWHVVREMLSARERSAGGYPLNPLYMGKREADARAVANALNLGRDLAAGGTDGE